VEVTPVNDAPVITAVDSLGISWNEPVVLTASEFTITDPDSNSPFTIAILDGEHYHVTDNTVRLDDALVEEIVVGVVASDGITESAPFYFPVKVYFVTRAEGRAKDHINVYPVPAKTTLRVEIGNVSLKRPVATVKDTSGKTLAVAGTWDQNRNVLTLDLATLPPGVYLLEIRDQGRTFHQRFIRD
jgi:methionine-rich copper-binding protein CopC